MRLLSGLTPRLQVARTVERQRDRRVASRFNVFRYLRKDELGLSRIIADLLDPTAEHGQGTSFLEAMLGILPETRGRFDALRPTAANPIRVMTERPTEAGGRIDITADIPVGNDSFCLAFENKPYAQDLRGQLISYVRYLRAKYETRFLLVYLPPIDREPDPASLPQEDRELWTGHFRVMPYADGDPSLEDWFANCRQLCGAERVNWFLEDAEAFCQQQFGESTMTTNPDTRFVHEYLSNNPRDLRAAHAVHDAWPLVRAEICQRFLEHLRDIVDDRLKAMPAAFGDDVQVRCHYGGEKRWSNYLWITRDRWRRYDDLYPGRTAVGIQSHHRQGGPNGWLWGVRSPKPLDKMTEAERERREHLDAALKESGLAFTHTSPWWSQWEWLPRYEDWHALVSNLHEECETGGGPITSCYVDGLCDIAKLAIPAISGVEETRV